MTTALAAWLALCVGFVLGAVWRAINEQPAKQAERQEK